MAERNSPLILGTEPIGKLLIQYSVPAIIAMTVTRSEERRVGKECRSRWSPYH